MDTSKMVKVTLAKIKSTKKGVGKTVKLVGVQIDNDLLPFLNALPNKSRFINDLLRKKFFGK